LYLETWRLKMAVKVRIPTPLRRLTDGKDEVSATGGDVREVIEDLAVGGRDVGSGAF
jgi:hypothetical protein